MRTCTVLVALAACTHQHHVRLEPPRPGITPEERVQLFWKMRPTQEGFVKLNDQVVNQTLFLGDKMRGEQIGVVSPEDLEPLVGSDSETMRFARASVVARGRARTWEKIGLAILAAGVVAFVWDTQRGTESTAWIPYSIAVAGGVIYYFVPGQFAHEELVLRAQAFEGFTRDLGLRLNVCAHGTQVVPCEAPLPSEPAERLLPATTAPARTAVLRMR